MNRIELGKTQELIIVRTADFGVYVGADDHDKDAVLLPKKQVPADAKIGSRIRVFVYKDSEDRMIATINHPYAEVGEFALLEVKEVSRVGAFLDWGLEKDLFLPYKEQEGSVKKGGKVLVYLYIDKSGRIASTMRVYDYLSSVTGDEFEKEQTISGIVYRVDPTVGTFVGVAEGKHPVHHITHLYFGLLPKTATFGKFSVGDEITAHIARIRADGKIDLREKKRAFEALDKDGRAILDLIDEFGGTLPFSDSASPEIIKRELGLSKAAFKRALGHLMKTGKVRINEDSVEKL